MALRQHLILSGLRWAGLVVPGAAALFVCGILGSSPGWGADLDVILSRDAEGKQVIPQHIDVRPNVEQHVYVFVKNNTGNEEEVVVRVVKLGPDDKPSPPLGEKGVTVPARGTVPVRFAEPKAEAKPAGAKSAGGPAAAPPPFVALDGPTFKIQLELLRKIAGAGKLPPRTVETVILAPHEYVLAQVPRFANRTLSVQVTADKNFTGPPCTVELDLSPELIPGLIATKKDGVYKQTLSKAGQIVELIARNLQFQGGQGPPSGRVDLTIDGYPRAYMFEAAFSTTSTAKPRRITDPVVALADRQVLSKPVEQIPLQLAVDNPPSEDVHLDVALARGREGKFELVRELPSARRKGVFLATADPSGALLFKTEIHDWQTDLDTAGIYGEARVRVQMVRNGTPVPGVRPALERLVFDDSPPEDVHFAAAKDFPRQLVRGDPLPVKATGSDPESDISEVVFFVGKPVKDKAGKTGPPPNVEVVKGDKLAGSEPLWWTALLPIPSDKKGTFDVSTQFVNGAGLSTVATIKIELVEPGPGGAPAAKKYTILGKVLEGDVLQPGLEVVLRDDKGAVKGTARTAKDGKLRGVFKFDNVQPGVYTVSSTKLASQTKGQAPVTVEASDVKNVEIQLYR